MVRAPRYLEQTTKGDDRQQTALSRHYAVFHGMLHKQNARDVLEFRCALLSNDVHATALLQQHLHLMNQQGPDTGKCRPGASRKVPPPSQGLKQSQAFQDGIIS